MFVMDGAEMWVFALCVVIDDRVRSGRARRFMKQTNKMNVGKKNLGHV